MEGSPFFDPSTTVLSASFSLCWVCFKGVQHGIVNLVIQNTELFLFSNESLWACLSLKFKSDSTQGQSIFFLARGHIQIPECLSSLSSLLLIQSCHFWCEWKAIGAKLETILSTLCESDSSKGALFSSKKSSGVNRLYKRSTKIFAFHWMFCFDIPSSVVLYVHVLWKMWISLSCWCLYLHFAVCLQSHLVAAFEKSLSNMTCRLQSLTMTAEQKVHDSQVDYVISPDFC